MTGSDWTVTIGVTRCSKLDDYVAAVEGAGARVRVVEVTEGPAQVLEQVDGIVLTGGADIDPSFYGELRHDSTVGAEPGRDAFELALGRRAMDRDLPLLAICRGAQVLNVAAGGTLVQNIPSEWRSALTHSIAEPAAHLCHAVAVRKGSRLARVLAQRLDRSGHCEVNSRHHQAVARLGARLVICAEAPDGIVEGIERPEARFCIGVQWHPENFWRTGEFNALFAALVHAAGERGLTPL